MDFPSFSTLLHHHRPSLRYFPFKLPIFKFTEICSNVLCVRVCVFPFLHFLCYLLNLTFSDNRWWIMSYWIQPNVSFILMGFTFSEQPSDLLVALMEHPVLVHATDSFKSIQERKVSASMDSKLITSSNSSRSVYLFQREYATVDPSLVHVCFSLLLPSKFHFKLLTLII